VTEITFLKSVHHYDSYTDFFKLAELAGFPVKRVDELDVSQPGVFITSPMNGDWREHLRSQADRTRNAHLILWNIERPAGSSGSVGQYGESNRRLMYGQEEDGSKAPCRYIDEVWVSDRQLALETGLRFVPLGSNAGMGRPGQPNEKRYDLVHISYTGPPRRQTIYNHFQKSQVGPNCWPPERDKVLQRSRFALNVHQDNHPFCEPLRFALFAAYGLPILTETVIDAFPYCDRTMQFANYDHLVPRMRDMLKDDYNRWLAMGQRCRDRMIGEFEFGKVVKEAVNQTVGDWR